MDRREAVLAQLLVLASGIGGLKTAVRNKDNISRDARPAIVVVDGDEEAAEMIPRERRPGQPAPTTYVVMTPEIRILLSGLPDDVGSRINAMRVALIKAVLEDDTLLTIIGSRPGRQEAPAGPITANVRYVGCATTLGRGVQVDGEMGVSFAIKYPLTPSEI